MFDFSFKARQPSFAVGPKRNHEFSNPTQCFTYSWILDRGWAGCETSPGMSARSRPTRGERNIPSQSWDGYHLDTVISVCLQEDGCILPTRRTFDNKLSRRDRKFVALNADRCN